MTAEPGPANFLAFSLAQWRTTNFSRPPHLDSTYSRLCIWPRGAGVFTILFFTRCDSASMLRVHVVLCFEATFISMLF